MAGFKLVLEDGLLCVSGGQKLLALLSQALQPRGMLVRYRYVLVATNILYIQALLITVFIKAFKINKRPKGP